MVNAATVIAVSVTFCTLAIICVALRFNARRKTSVGIQADDYWALFALVATMAYTVTDIIEGIWYAHVYTESTSINVQKARSSQSFSLCSPLTVWQDLLAHFILYVVSVSSVKTAILLFYKRTFERRSVGIAIHVVLAIVTTWAVAFIVLVPINHRQILNAEQSGPTTNPGWSVMIALYSSDVLIDLTILCLPIFFIRDLRMAMNTKFALGGLFTLGAAASVAGVVQLYYWAIWQGGSWPFYVWSTVEPCLGIICICLPLLHPYFRRHAPETIIAAHSASYQLVDQPVTKVYKGRGSFAKYESRVQGYHENVID